MTFICFPKSNYSIKRTRFQSVKVVKERWQVPWKSSQMKISSYSFKQWKFSMERYRDKEWMYIEGDNS